MSRLRILVLAPDANPESISVALVCFRHAEALARVHTVTLVGRAKNEESLRRDPSLFHAVEAIRNPWLDRVFAWSVRRVFRNNYHNHVLTAFAYPFALAFEWRAWLSVRRRIVAGEFDVVLRLAPITSVLPSIFPYLLRKSGIPFVIGPINGGLPWPKGFSQIKKQKRWIDSLRKLNRLMPFARSTYHRAAAIIAGSSQIYSEFTGYGDKLFFIPENGISGSLCSESARRSEREGEQEFMFLGALIPCKACDLAIRAAAPLLRSGLVRFTIIGDGPERTRLEGIAKSLGVEEHVSFLGMLSHAEAMRRLRGADVLVFPSLRDFGGGVVYEALAVGAVPVVVDFGGPGDTVRPGIGFKVPLTNEESVVSEMEGVLRKLVSNRNLREQLSEQAVAYARENLTWEAKAQSTTRVLRWVLKQGPKPDLLPPNSLAVETNCSIRDLCMTVASGPMHK